LPSYGISEDKSWRESTRIGIKRALGKDIPIHAVMVSEERAFLLVPRWALKYNDDPRIQIGKRPVTLVCEPLVEYALSLGATVIQLWRE